MEKRKLLSWIAPVIGFIIYNISIFVLFGFSNHTVTFWTAYIFVILVFVAVCVMTFLSNNQPIGMRDWLFKWPLIKHSILFGSIEFVLSIVFMVFEKHIPITISFVLQLIFFGVYIVFGVSCLWAKETIEDVHQNVKENTKFMKNLRVEADMLVHMTEDKAIKYACQKLAEQIRFSDPISSPELSDLEETIFLYIKEIKIMIQDERLEDALSMCDQASKLLGKRNEKCKAWK